MKINMAEKQARKCEKETYPTVIWKKQHRNRNHVSATKLKEKKQISLDGERCFPTIVVLVIENS